MSREEDPGAGGNAPAGAAPGGFEGEGGDSGQRTIDDVIADWLEAAERGDAPDPERVIDAHPGLERDLRAFFAGDAGARAALAPAAAIEPSRPPGTRFGEYELLEEIGRGGMGVVYRARHVRLGRVVALKTVAAAASADGSTIERFQREARAAAALEHPGIVAIHEVGETEGLPFFTMSLLSGGSLAERAQRFAEDARAAARLVESLARAVHHAHLMGIIHRDLKPANVLLNDAGDPKITDFGLARLDGEATMTAAGDVLGTPAYMAPEQASGHAAEWTAACDVYSLGVILYELLAGRRPFRGATPLDVLRAVRDDEPERPSSARHGVPRDLEIVCLKCLDKDPGRRYGSAAELADDLERFLAGVPIAARRASPVVRAYRWCRRNRALAAVMVLLSVLAIGSTMSLLVIREKSRAAEVAKEEARRHARQALFDQARLARSSTLAGRRFGAVAALAEAARIEPGLDLRNEAAACLTLVDIGRGRRLDTGDEGGDDAVAIDGAFRHYAVANREGRVVLRSVDAEAGESTVVLRDRGRRTNRLLFGPRGRYLGVGEKGDSIEVIDVESRARVLRATKGGERGNWDFSPDGERIVIAGTDTLTVFRLDAGAASTVAERSVPVPGAGRIPAVRWAPSGGRAAAVAFTAIGWRGGVVDLDSGRALHSWPEVVNASSLAWHPGGVHLAVGAPHGISIREVESGKEVRSIAKSQVTAIEFHPTGRFLGATGWDAFLSVFDTDSGQLLGRVAGNCGAYFRDDGGAMASGSIKPTLEVFEVADGSELIELRCESSAEADLKDLDVSPDGRWIVSGGFRAVRLWDLERRVLARVLPTSDWTGSCFFAGAGRSIVAVGKERLHRWDLTSDGSWEPRSVRRPVVADTVPRGALDPRGERVAVVDSHKGGGASILDLRTGRRAGPELEFHALRRIHWSPDGRWLAGTQRHGDGHVRIWDAPTGAIVRDLEVRHDSSAAFSPDSRLLVVGDLGEYVAWSAGDWTPLWRLERDALRMSPVFRFAGDGSLLAVFDDVRTVRLVRPRSGEVLLRLSAPGDSVLGAVTLGADARLVAAVTGDDRVLVWDLARLRRQLREIGLDWEPPLADEVGAAGRR